MLRAAKTLIIMTALVFAACGGDSGDGAVDQTEETQMPQASTVPTAVATTQTTGADLEEPIPTEAPPDEPTTAPDEGTGIAVVGDHTWEFALSGDAREMCNPNLSGFFFVNMFGEDDSGQEIALSIQVPNSGGDGVVQAGGTVITEELWIADLDVYTANGGISLPEGIGATATVTGNTVSGVATFYEDRALGAARGSGGAYEAGVLEGTFTVSCPGS